MAADKGPTMKLTTCLYACLVLVCVRVAAQGISTPTVGFDNVHILSPTPVETREWYMKYLGATVAPVAGQAYLGKTLLVFLKNDKAQPSTGSTIDHLGVSVASVDATMKALEAGGATVITAVGDVRGLFRAGVVQDPWGVKIEVLHEPGVTGLHHIHLRVRDSEATLAWFEQMMGGERAKLHGRLDGLRYGPMWLLVDDSGAETTSPSGNRAIQHIAWRVPNIDEARTTLVGRGLQIGEPRPFQDLRFAIFDAPSGVRVEIIQRPQ
jgi:lactoylglutathione lyase